MKKNKSGNYLLWKDDKLSLYRVKQPSNSQYMLRYDGGSITGDTISEIMEIFKETK